MAIIRWIVTAMLLATAGSVMAGGIEVREFDDPVLEKRYRDLTASMRCPLCENQAIDDSDAPISADMRERVSSVRGLIGARVNRMEITRNVLDRISVEMTTILSADEDVDLTSTIVNLQQEQDVFQAALASGNVLIPQSLMDFI